MLKKVYVNVAQAAPSFIPNGIAAYSDPVPSAPHGLRRWLASLGAIYHLDRMIALDIPWWNVRSARHIEEFLRHRPNARVFEYGSGASTVWLARRASSITSVEHNAAWATKLKGKLTGYPNARLVVAGYDLEGVPAEQPYVCTIEGTGLYDMIVVDGRLRVPCLAKAFQHLLSDGIIVFDDSGRGRYRSAIESGPLAEKRYFGLSYCVPYPDHTSVLTNNPWP